MQEFEIIPGRHLVSADMGEGYHQWDDPSRVFGFLMNRWAYIMRGFTSENQFKQLDTVELEMAFLKGERYKIDILVEKGVKV